MRQASVRISPDLASRIFHPCLVIPTFNNRDTIYPVLASVERLNLPCFVVDDGSNAVTKAVLQQCERQFPWVTLITHERNYGQGVAVLTAATAARKRGYTHGVQIDADGQHDVADIRTFLKWSEIEPRAIVVGKPIFDGTAPRARLYGRKLTHFCIWLETLSFAVKDGLCGFRCYPLDELEAVSQKVRLGRRMDFDPDVLVRLIWDGVPVINVETRVRYFANGLSHFKMVRDNISMVRLHLKLIAQLLFRFPLLLKTEDRLDDRVWHGMVIPLS